MGKLFHKRGHPSHPKLASWHAHYVIKSLSWLKIRTDPWTIPLEDIWVNFENRLLWFLARPRISNGNKIGLWHYSDLKLNVRAFEWRRSYLVIFGSRHYATTKLGLQRIVIKSSKVMQVSIWPVTIPPGLLHRNVCPAPGLLHNRKCPGSGL